MSAALARRAALLAGLLASGCGGGEPTDFGVNVKLEAQQLSSEMLGSITQAVLVVTGAEPFNKAFDIHDPIRSGEVRFRYVPKIRTGVIELVVDALDATNTLIASGDSGMITLTDGKAVDATIVLTIESPDLGAPDGGGDDLPPGPDLLQPKKQGDPCTASPECGTVGGCVDGFCCDTPCAGSCNACNVPQHEGTCYHIAAGSAPNSGHAACGPDAMSTCGKDGKCDGAGACRLWVLGTVCKPSLCDSGTNLFTDKSSCDGKGVCGTPVAITCAPYVCKDASSCNNPPCTGTTQCSTGNVCSAGSCGLKGLGATCGAAGECATNFCVDGVCCENGCTGPCNTCNQSSNPGKCLLVPMGQDPRGMCPASAGGDAYCTPGGCDGPANRCLVSSAGTACNGSCNGGTPVNFTCDTVGKCTQAAAGNPCGTCKMCTVASTTALCSNQTDGTVCAASVCGGVQGNFAYGAAICTNGACGSQNATNCGMYKCYLYQGTATCYAGCYCCGSAVLCLQPNNPHPEFCVSGMCNTTVCPSTNTSPCF